VVHVSYICGHGQSGCLKKGNNYHESINMSKKRTMQIDVIEEVKGTQYLQCKLYIDGNASVILMNKIDYERLKEEGIFIRDGKSRDSAGVINTTNTFIEKD